MNISPALSNDRMDQADTGGARRPAACAGICPNIRPDTATSVIWNVTSRLWRTILAPILISSSLSVVSDQCYASSDTADFSFGSSAEVEDRAGVVGSWRTSGHKHGESRHAL